MSSHVALKTEWILISWLLQKTAELDSHCLQAWLYTVLESVNCLSTERYTGKLICTMVQVKFSLDKYIMAIYK